MDDLLNHPEDAQAMDIDSDDSFAEYPPSTYTVRRRPRREASGLRFTRRRELGGTVIASPQLITWIEGQTLRRLDLGRYIDLDRNAQLVRSTISIAFSHDGRFFASTHGDHSVKVFEYPTGKQISCLDGHPRTPWTVRFHPHDSSIIASGCLGSECRVWNVLEQKCIRKHTFRASISCVSFSPDGSLLAVTSGRSLLLWDYNEGTAFGGKSTVFDSPGPGVPRELLGGNNPFHMVDFHPSGTMLMTGEKNRPPNTGRDHAQSSPDQFTLKLVIHRFDRRTGLDSSAPLLTVPRAVAYNDAGIHFSPCGTMLVACIPRQEDPNAFRIAVMSVARDQRLGKCLYSTELDKGHVTALTNLKFSSTSDHILAGFSFRPLNPVLRAHAEQYDANTSDGSTNNGSGFHGSGTSCIPRKPQVRVVDIYRVDEKFEMIRSLSADMDISEANVGGGGAEDEINVAVFAPVSGVADGIIYGTQKGRIRMFQIATGKAWRHQSGCDNNCSNDVMCIEPSNCFPDTQTPNTHSTPERVESSSDTETREGESSE